MILSARIDTALRLLKRTPREAMARRDAALAARIERAWWRQTRDSQDGRNVAARNTARRYLAGLGYEV